MSRYAPIDEAIRPSPPPGRILRHRKRRPLHPDEIRRRLRVRAEATSGANLPPTPYGWIVALRRRDYSWRYLHTEPGATRQDAIDLLEVERKRDHYVEGWIRAKTEP